MSLDFYAHIRDRLRRMDESYRDSFPKWTQTDYIAVGSLMTDVSTLRYALAQRSKQLHGAGVDVGAEGYDTIHEDPYETCPGQTCTEDRALLAQVSP